ncbi:MAG: ATP-dependent helicase [Clostridium sp.]|nr:ATP-dependent helicase [Acetatifactor muris]MCM1527148.1 ATP-dependent helicase [Bacteroides sp.]MCM1563463.1 ATP-dependent helicase [Clostridium sp.]
MPRAEDHNRTPQEEQFLAGLNASQRRAVAQGEGPALVLAGPGSGKTTVIVRRILYLIQIRHVPPEEILVVTFTKDAALSMQQRFLSRAGSVCPVVFGTFHSIFYHILLQSRYWGNDTKILSTSRKKHIIMDLLRAYGPDSQGRYDRDTLESDAEVILEAVSYYKNTMDSETAARRMHIGRRESFREIFEEYRRRCRAEGGLDFDDMVYECGKFLQEDEAGRRYWQDRFRYILIDEFQDINPLQYEVVKILGERHHNLFAVGDDDQSIYGFRGSGPECLRRFAEEYGAEQILLNINYRSTKEIVSAAERVIRENQNRFAKDCVAAQNEGNNSKNGKNSKNDVILHSFENVHQEMQYLVKELQDLLQKHPQESCGVLFRTNSGMQILASLLTREGIPYRMKEQTGGPYEHFIAEDIMAYLKLAAGDRRRELFLRIANRPLRYISRDSLGERDMVDLRELRNRYLQRGRRGDDRIAASVLRLEQQLRSMSALSPATAILYLCRAVGYEDYLRQRKGADRHLAEWLALLEFLREDARAYDNVWEWERAQKAKDVGMRAQNNAVREDTVTENTVRTAEQNSAVIRLMTVHASKGLEFDRVYMPDCNEKIYPHGSLPDAGAVEEERRIFYVGITRARKHLEFLCTHGTKERPVLLSRFLNPILDHSSINSSNSQLSRYSSNASTTFSYSSSSSI